MHIFTTHLVGAPQTLLDVRRGRGAAPVAEEQIDLIRYEEDC